MLVDFFLHLKARRIPVTTTEYLALLEALEAGLANYNLDDFYALSRLCLVKNESMYDRFDLAFSEYFKANGATDTSQSATLTDEWLHSAAQHFLSPEQLADIDAFETQEAEAEDKEVAYVEDNIADDSESLTGNRGDTPLAQGGITNKETHVEAQSSGNRRAVKAWNSRDFEELDGERELGTRNIKIALRRLRKFARQGNPDELDLDDTIRSTARNAGWLDIKMRAERQNQVKVIILFDRSGSMDSYVKQCEELFSAARSEFKQLEYYYFNNCIYHSVWRYDNPSQLSYYPIPQLLREFGKDCKLIIVGDAAMGTVELVEAGEGLHQTSKESGEVWIQRLVDHFKHAVWLNPEQERFWKLTESIQLIKALMSNRMFPLTLSGLDDAMRALNK